MKVAVLSFAQEHAATYVCLLRDIPGVEVVAADPDGPPGDPGRGTVMAERLGVAYAGSWDEVFALRPGAVVVTSEVARRRELVERAAAVGAQVLCEQPLAAEVTDAQAVVDACAAAGVRLTLASPPRFGPAFAAVRRAVADGDAVGRLMTLHGAYDTTPGRDAPGPTAPGPSAAPQPADRAGWAAHAAYLLDMVDAVLGGKPAEEVYAQANTLLGPADGAGTTALLSVRYADGAVAALHCGGSLLPGAPGAGRPTMTFVGDRGSVELSASPRLLGGFDGATGTERWEEGGADATAAMLGEFVAAVREGRSTGPDGAAGVRTMRIIQAAHASVHSGRPVAVAAAPTRRCA